MVRFGSARGEQLLVRDGGVAGRVVEANGFAVPDGVGQGNEYVQRDDGGGCFAGTADCGDLKRVEAVSEPRGHHLTDGAEGADRGLLDSRPDGGRRLQRDGDSDGLIVVEQEWW